jgi:hypothetical protein
MLLGKAAGREAASTLGAEGACPAAARRQATTDAKMQMCDLQEALAGILFPS